MLYEWSSPALPGPVRLNLRPSGTNLMLGTDQVYSFDGEGRLVTAYTGGRLYKRGLDHRVLEKWRPEGSERLPFSYRDLAADEKLCLLAEVRTLIALVLEDLPATVPSVCRERMEQLGSWDEAAYACDQQRFRAIYRPVPILPPDQYMALVLQATEGCHYNRCSFCHFYRDREFHIKPLDEFQAHIAAIKKWLGAGILMRPSIFLADANALVLPMAQLLPRFEAIGAAFRIAPRSLAGRELANWRVDHPGSINGIYAFLDAFTGKRKTSADFAALAERGLRRVYIGMESGHEPLLQFVRKPSLPAEVRAVVQAAKSAGVHVGVIIMLGLGGQHFAAGHSADTAAVINSLGLSTGDLLYFSPFSPEPGSDYEALAQEAGIQPLSSAEIELQAQAIRAGLHFDQAPMIATYNIRESIY